LDGVAADYDAPGGANAPEVVVPMVDVLEDLADSGPVLEFAVGTGRIAAPLAARGLAVSGIELSRAMAGRIADKSGGDKVEVTIGDITTTRVAGQFSLAYLVFNTIGNVTTQDGQVDVFCNAAAHLRRGGLFLIEVGVPDLRRLPPGQDTVPFTVAPGRIPFRYAWPTEMDLMARIAGLSLKYRWAGWDRSAFTAESTTHVSVWQKR
jgi:SAM-dependent methyltransferase